MSQIPIELVETKRVATGEAPLFPSEERQVRLSDPHVSTIAIQILARFVQSVLTENYLARFERCQLTENNQPVASASIPAKFVFVASWRDDLDEDGRLLACRVRQRRGGHCSNDGPHSDRDRRQRYQL